MSPRAWAYSLLFGAVFWIAVIVLVLLASRFVIEPLA